VNSRTGWRQWRTSLARARAVFTRCRLVLGSLLGLGLGVVAWWNMLPEPLFQTPRSYLLESRAGTLLSARIAADGQWRFPASEHVPVKFKRALLVYEDKRFDEHWGVDPLAIARAVRLNTSAGRVVSGGSTLTMQLARLANGRAGRGYGEKTLEALLALRIEASYSKREILALYASNAPFGGNVVGLEAAAWRYFGRPPETLSWAEAATLAVLPSSPTLVHVSRNRERLRSKRDALLRRMAAAGDFTPLDLDLALAEPLVAEPHDLPDLAPHLLETLRVLHPERHRLRTTLDARLQASAAQQLNEHSAVLSRQGVHNAAALVIDNENFEVLAYIGNKRDIPNISETNRNVPLSEHVDIIRRPRSTGSILKPILFAAMLEDGLLTPSMLLPDVPTHYEGFVPENFDRQYRGAVRAEEALAQSLNIPAVRMLKAYGVARFADLLRNAGVTTLSRPADDYGLTLILGGAEGNLWEVSSMYASLAAMARTQAHQTTPTFIEPTVLLRERARDHAQTPIGAGSAWLTLKTLLEVKRPGEEGAWRQFASSRRIAWKTGTSWGLRDGWSVGSSSRYTVGVWVGNASGEGKPGLTGSAMAAPLMFSLFNGLPTSAWFDMPIHALRAIDTCANDGYLANDTCSVERTWIPKNSHFDLLTPHNLRVNLDARIAARVTGECESPGNMRHANWFVLPPAEEYYFRRAHSDYRPLPDFRPDCAAGMDATAPLAIVYPNQNASVLIPRELDGRRGRTIFEAVHRRRGARIYWHLDDQYLGETHTFHQQSLDMEPGSHILTLVDDEGRRVARRFEVLATR
jgi:penicillin-binding protein 1C